MSIDNKDHGTMFTPEELMDSMNLEKVFTPKVDEQLVDDFIIIAGYSEEDAYAAAASVQQYDNF